SVITFASDAGNLVANDFNSFRDIFAYVQSPPRVQSLQINDGTPQRSMVRTVTVNFDQPVSFTGDPAAAFSLVHSSLPTVPIGVSASASGWVNSITLSFSGALVQNGSLVDGLYTLLIDASQVRGIGLLDGNGDGTGGDQYVSP